jgi:hypothetical protein
MDVTFNKTTFSPGEQVAIQASLSQGGLALGSEHVTGGSTVDNATIDVAVTIPGVPTIQRFTLAPIGAGRYSGTFSNTARIGTYRFAVEASGSILVSGAVTAVQQSFTRQTDQSVYVSPPFSGNAVLFATNSISIQDSSRILSGSIIVNNANGRLVLGVGSTSPTGFALKADSVAILPGANVAGDVYFDRLNNLGTIGGKRFSPLPLPVLSTLPPFETAVPGTKDIIVLPGLKATINPGKYRIIIVFPRGTLTFTGGGSYDVTSIWVEDNAKLVFNAAAHVRVRFGVDADNGTYIGPANGSSIDASNISFYVGGADSLCQFLKAGSIGGTARIFANFYAPSGTITLKDGTQATGAFLASNVVLGKKVQVTLGTAFTGMAKRGGWTEEPFSSPDVAEIPTTYVLTQNFPNPFNPSTQIRYGLPKATHITLSVFNMLGEEVTRLVDEVQSEGFHEVRWNGTTSAGATLPTGVYLYRVKADSFTDVRKMILLK